MGAFLFKNSYTTKWIANDRNMCLGVWLDKQMLIDQR